MPAIMSIEAGMASGMGFMASLRPAAHAPLRLPLAGAAIQETATPEAALLDLLRTTPELRHVEDNVARRFLAREKGDVSKAAAALREREEFCAQKYGDTSIADVNSQTAGMAEQIRTGKCFLLNTPDTLGRTVIMMRACKHTPSTSMLDQNTLFMAMLLKEAEARFDNAAKQTDDFGAAGHSCVIFDFSSASPGNIDIGLTKRLIQMSSHFPGLGVIALHNAPSFFSKACWPLIKPLLSEAISSKVRFTHPSPSDKRVRLGRLRRTEAQSLGHWLGTTCLPSAYGGEDGFDYAAALDECKTEV